MDLDKRYCQNRVRKRNPKLKKLLEKDDFDSEKDGRQLKLNRFLRDVSTFAQSNDNSPLAKIKRYTFRGGIQTKYFKRDGLRKGETSRLDENLYKILGVANKENKNPCTCLHHCKSSSDVLPKNETEQPLVESNLRLASASSTSSSPSILYKSNVVNSKKEKKNLNPLYNYEELDRKLYPEFTCIITVTFTKLKSTLYPKRSYTTALKKRLLCLYMKGKKENSQDSKSVGTSPLDNSSLGKRHSLFTETPSEPGNGPSEEGRFTLRDFVNKPMKSIRQLLEENIGPPPRSILKPKKCLPVEQRASIGGRHEQSWCHPSSRPVCTYEPPAYSGPSPPLPSPPQAYRGSLANNYDFLTLHQPKWFIPAVEEDSPEFQYFPRKMI